MTKKIQRRGSVLMVILATMFVLLTLVAGLHYRQSTARASMFHEEARLQARIAAEYELAHQCAPNATFAPEKQAVKVENLAPGEPELESLSARKLFSDQGPADLSQLRTLKGDSLSGRGGMSWNLAPGSSSDLTLQVDRSRFLSVVSHDFPYAACAPNGTIQAQEVMAWHNQLFGQAKVLTRKAHSGGVARLAAKGDIAVAQCDYGQIFTESGKITVGKGLFVGYPGPPGDLRGANAYPETVRRQIQAATARFLSQTQDKTPQLCGTLFDIDTVLSFFKGAPQAEEALARSLSLRSAMKFPFFMIPGIRIKGIIVMIWLHMPYAPDTGTRQISDQSKKELDDKTLAVETKQKEIDKLKADEAAETDPNKKKDLAKQVSAAEKDSEKLNTELTDLGEKIANETGAKDDGSPFKLDPGPANRDGEAGYTDQGLTGWSYKPFYKKIFDFCADCAIALFTGKAPDVEKWGKSLYQEVRLVHFGGKSFDTEFDIEATSAKLTATMNVPPGRGIRLNTDLTLNGDLWLMRGSSLVVQGNLIMTNPNQGKFDPRLPRGRIFLEEGANLVVTGNLTCAGSELLGSVLIGTPIQRIRPGLSSILVGGDANIPFGVWPAFSLGDLDLKELPELKTFRDIIATVVPNLAKLSGPFHRRKPYFSSYATTFLCACVLTPLGPVPVPIPLPLPTPANINVKIFRALSMIYSIQMNLAWGENFLTHCDWWFLGQGTVPMFPKVDPTVYVDRLKNLKFPELPDFDKIKDMVADKAPDLAKKMIPPLLTQTIVKLVVDQLSFGLGGALVEAVPLEEWVNKVLGIEDVQTALLEVPGLKDLAESIKTKVGDEASLMLAHETPGLLISAGGDLTVANDQTLSAPVPLTVGCYIAGRNVHCNASVLVGSALSLGGNVRLKNLLYDPNTTRCSLYLPLNSPNKITTIDWLDWAIDYRYGKFIENTQDAAIDIGPSLRHARVEGWIQ